MAEFSLVAVGANSARLYDKEGGTLKYTIGVKNQSVATVNHDAETMFVILYDSSAREMQRATLYRGLNYLYPTVALTTDTSADNITYPGVYKISDDLKKLVGRVKKASESNSATILHIASGYVPSAAAGVNVTLDGTTDVAGSVSTLGDVTITGASWTTASVDGFWR